MKPLFVSPTSPDLASLATNRLRLPTHKHTPGSGSQPELDYLGSITQRVPKQVCASNWRGNLPYRYGWYLFLNGYFWESHEIWEAVWIRTPINSQQRFLLQSLIQLANAGLKRQQDKHKAAKRILNLVPALLESAFPPSPHTEMRILGITRGVMTELTFKMHNIT